MSFLFHIENKTKVMPKPEVLLIEPFKTIWNRDKTRSKEKALAEFAYVELFTSKKRSNPYRDYNDKARKELLKKNIIKIKSWEEDKHVKQAIDLLNEFQFKVSPTYKHYKTALHALSKIDSFLNSFDLDERSPKTGLPIYKPSDIYNALTKVDHLTETLKKLEKKIHEELEDATSIRGNKMITFFNDPQNFVDG